MKLKIRHLMLFALLCLLFILISGVYFNYVSNDNPLRNNRFLEPLEVNTKILFDIQKKVTLLLKYADNHHAILSSTINSFLSAYPNMHTIVVSDNVLSSKALSEVPNQARLKVVHLNLDLLHMTENTQPLSHLKTKYLLIVPLGAVALAASSIESFMNAIEEINTSMLAVPVFGEKIECLNILMNLKEWTLHLQENKGSTFCDFVDGVHGLFMKAESIKKIPQPFMSPFPEAMYLQMKTYNMNAKIVSNLIFTRNADYLSNGNMVVKNNERIIMYHNLRIKRVIRENGLIEWYGCTRQTARCFPTIIDSTPSYLLIGRWTPPCCLKVLREVTQHVIKTLSKYKVTYWLEGGSLLGAMRNKDIIPWDYDVDLGILLSDVDKCPWLKNISDNMKVMHSQAQRYTAKIEDDKGFVWAPSFPQEGNFFRVFASDTNKLHVDIFPFYSKNGIMTKDTWMEGHPQDKEFPEHYLKPLTTIEFAGIEAQAPNNIKEFLEFKFGKGCVENPKYPNETVVAFPSEGSEPTLNESEDEN